MLIKHFDYRNGLFVLQWPLCTKTRNGRNPVALKMEVARTSETVEPCTILHSVTSQKIST